MTIADHEAVRSLMAESRLRAQEVRWRAIEAFERALGVLDALVEQAAARRLRRKGRS